MTNTLTLTPAARKMRDIGSAAPCAPGLVQIEVAAMAV